MESNSLRAKQLVDLAIGTPEAGAVNFRILHSLLHVIVKNLNLDNCRIELLDSDGTNIEEMSKAASRKAQLKVFEYELTEDGKRIAKEHSDSVPVDRVFVVSAKGRETEGGTHVASTSKGGKNPSKTKLSISEEDFNQLSKRVESIHDAVAAILPDNQTLLEHVRRSGDDEGANPIGEMCNLLNITKRLDAAELSLNKLSSLVNDLAREFIGVENSITPFVEGGEMEKMAKKMDALQRSYYDLSGKHLEDSEPMKRLSRESLQQEHKQDQDLTRTSEKSPPESSLMDHQVAQDPHMLDLPSPKSSTSSFFRRRSSFLEKFEALVKDVGKIKKDLKSIKSSRSGKVDEKDDENVTEEVEDEEEIPSLSEENESSQHAVDKDLRFSELEQKLEEFARQVQDLQDRIKNIPERDTSMTAPARESTGQRSSAITESEEIAVDLNLVKSDIEKLIEMSQFLVGEKETLMEQVESLSKELEELKSHKADKEEVEEMLLDKADFSLLQRKVSFDQFDATKRDLSKNITELIAKLSEKEHTWQQTIDDMQQLVGSKLDKDEISPLKDYISDKIQKLQGRLKALSALKEEAEAAGTRSKVLRDVNCVSCDKDVVMPTVEKSANLPMAPKMPATKCPGKALKSFELKGGRKGIGSAPGRFSTNLGGVNRYCGGSHTVISPRDRTEKCGFHRVRGEPCDVDF